MEKQFVPFAQQSGALTVTLIVLGVILFILFCLYVSLVQKKNATAEAFSDIDVQLKKRYDLIPNILVIANKFMEHERELLTNITSLRTQAAKLPAGVNNVQEKLDLDGKISGMMGQLMVAVENYPQLKSDQTMIQAMQTYSEQEEHIAAARRFYNAAAKDLKNAVEIFPSSFIAMLCNIKAMPFIEATEQERQRIDASQYFTK